MKVFRSQLFIGSLVALRSSDPTLFEVVAADIKYLIARRHDALLPQVRFGIVQSAFPGVLGEVRSHISGEQAFVRTLFAMPADEWCCAFLIIGDKNTSTRGTATGNAWYSEAVPIADAIWREIDASRNE
jgi:hypothetical protein